jgi:hypothetical protein
VARWLSALAFLALLWLPSSSWGQLLIGPGSSAAQGCGSHCLMAVNGDSYAGGTWVDWRAGRVVTNTDAAQDAATVWRGTNSIGFDAAADQLSVPDSADWAATGDFCESVWLYADPPATGTATIWQQDGARVVGVSSSQWVQVAPQLGAETYIYSLAVLDGVIYGGTGPGGRLYRWDGVDEWVQVAPQLGAEQYIRSLAVLDGSIYGGTSTGGRLYRWDGVDEWVQVAPQLGAETYIYSLAVLDGVIYGGTYPGGRLYRWDGVDEWVQVAPQLGGEQCIYSLAVLDGVIYGGTYPGGRLAEYYHAGTVTATYTLADASTVALHGGTLTGAAWQQVEVCRSGGTAYLYVDGELVDTAAAVGALANPAAPLTLGAAGTTLIGSYDEWVMTSDGWAWTRTHSPGRCVGRRC